jgi:putative ABC transport system permease protein
MTFVSGWRLALRLAWREAARSRARSLLVLVMVTFPVVAVVAADVAQATASVSAPEGLDRRIGSSQALVTALPHTSRVVQGADPDQGTMQQSGRGATVTLAEIERALGGRRPVTGLALGSATVRTDLGVLNAQVMRLDLTDPLTEGLFRLTDGRRALEPDEVDVNRALADEGFAIGDTLRTQSGRSFTVVGYAESTGLRDQPLVTGPLRPGPAGPNAVRSWLVGGTPVTWAQVQAVNAVGATVVSRAVIEHPPPTSDLPPALQRAAGQADTQIYTILALIGVMALTEVVLLAGPAFAVGARRQSRALALIGANGGTPTQSRRTVLATAVVLGSLGAVVGAVLGVLVGRALIPVLQRQSATWFGPFQVRWTHVVAIAAFGLLSALLAALVPAWVASRQDVVAVLAGRRGDRAVSRRSPLIGLVLIGVGIVLAWRGAGRGAGELLIAAGAVLSVFGMIFLVPVVVVAVARLGRRMPLPLRYAVRDAARHRTRTVPAVAAVAATVAGLVALAIGNASDQAQQKAEYVDQVPVGTGVVTDYGRSAAFLPAARRLLDDAGTAPQSVRGVPTSPGGRVRAPALALAGPARRLELGSTATFGTQAVVADHLPPLLPDQVGASERAAADAALARGGVVVFSSHRSSLQRATVVVRGTSRGSGAHPRLTLPAYALDVGGAYAPAVAVLSPEAARRLSLPVVPTALLFDAGRLDARALDDLRQRLQGLSPRSGYVYVESGYQVAGTEKVVLWILFGMAVVLMLGGTLTATFLALSDARPDLATLSAVGASPRTRRGVAAAYAVAVGLVGAVLGAAVGFIPGIAISYPLTRSFSGSGPSHYVDIPWPLIGALVLALPLATALVVGLVARSRLPVVARLD